MNLENFYITNTKNINYINEQSQIIEPLKKIITKIQNAFNILNIDNHNMYIHYQRQSDKNSILAIKVTPGDNNDKSNYMFTGCNPSYYNNQVLCDVYMHADAKSAQRTIELSRIISKDITNFFKEVEKIIYENNEFEKEFSIIIPMENKSEIKKNESKQQSKTLSKKIKNKLKNIITKQK